ncbi:hypothetical protein [Mycolicibacterium cosmeticum]|uniref:hypothetical protein n=1 Tax=Mycolicibacterium cosmeticum TaxID=258533 RepID=UPI0032048848
MAAAQRLGIRAATLAGAMRQAGITTAITEKQAQRWTADPESAPKWLMQLRGERLRTPPEPGAEVVVRDHGGHLRRAQVVEVDGPLFEATFSLKSGQWRRRWFDLAAIEPSEVNSL